MFDALAKEIANRRCIIFIGSGVSASSLHAKQPGKRPPTWADLLSAFSATMSDPAKSDIDSLVASKKYLEAAEKIRGTINHAEYTRILKAEFSGYKPSTLHELILGLDQYVVITTNYDKIFESASSKGVDEGLYTTCKYYDTKLVSDLRSSMRLLVKIHGCIDDTEKTIISKSDYYKLRRDYSRFFEVISALFLTHTILFIGYSLDDPDMQLILENVNISAQSALPHYAILQQSEADEKGWWLEKIHNVKPIPYENGKHEKVVEIIQGIKDSADAMRA